ncbi:HAD family hydrolase [uncultured Anaerococcus sp.]|uniref:HAD family hydrolase n=1 Tax=uncultured Anaerococcus sp. TaxID=293428 RepID=UPI0025F527D5|nr:HAD family hydrolase [uncultured Anaerococcus sp.]
MIKLITSDIDETLVDNLKNVPEINTRAIAKAEDNGIKVMLATGRGPYELRQIPSQAGVTGKDRFIICCNGAITLKADTREIVDSMPLEFEYAKNVFEFAYKNNLQFFVYTLDRKYAINLDPIEESNEYTNETRVEEIQGDNIDFLKDEILLKALIKNNDIDFLHSLEVDVAKITDYSCEIAYSSDLYMEINAKNVNKATALKKVCEHYGFGMENTLVIGDNYNDVAMIEAAGIGVAVANAHLQVKEVADFVTDADNEEGAVAEAIKKYAFDNK